MTIKLGDSGFCVGDIVVLKTGGRKLTVFDLVEGKLIVHWFANDKKVNYARFVPSQLTPASKIDDTKIDDEALSPEIQSKLEALVQAHLRSWSIGDVVRLNSGGPLMSIRISHETFTEVDWIDSKGEHRDARFHPEELCHGNEDTDLSGWSFGEAKGSETGIARKGKG